MFVDLLIKPEDTNVVDTLIGGLFFIMLSLIPYLYQRSLCQIKELNPISDITKRECRSGLLLNLLLVVGGFFILIALITLIEYLMTFEYETFSATLGLLMFGAMFALPYYNICRLKEIETNKEPIKFFGKRFKSRPKCPNCGSSTIEKKEDHYVCAYCGSILDLIDK